MHVCLYGIRAYECRHSQRSEVPEPSWAGGISCLPDVGAGNHPGVLWKSKQPSLHPQGPCFQASTFRTAQLNRKLLEILWFILHQLALRTLAWDLEICLFSWWLRKSLLHAKVGSHSPKHFTLSTLLMSVAILQGGYSVKISTADLYNSPAR